MQESQNGCKRNNLRADEETQLTVARTQKKEEQNDSGVRPAGREDQGIDSEVCNKKEQSKRDNK